MCAGFKTDADHNYFSNPLLIPLKCEVEWISGPAIGKRVPGHNAGIALAGRA